MAFCGTCGAPLEDGAQFCGTCGAVVTPEPGVASVAPVPAAYAFPSAYQAPGAVVFGAQTANGMTPQKRKKSKKPLVVVLAVLLTIGLCIGALALIPAPGNNHKLAWRAFDADDVTVAGVTMEGYLYIWGSDWDASSPSLIDTSSTWSTVCCGRTSDNSNAVYALSADGGCWMWTHARKPVEIPASVNFCQIVTPTEDYELTQFLGGPGVVALDVSGKIWCSVSGQPFKDLDVINNAAPYVEISCSNGTDPAFENFHIIYALDGSGQLFGYGQEGLCKLGSDLGPWKSLFMDSVENARGEFYELLNMTKYAGSGNWLSINESVAGNAFGIKNDGSLWIWSPSDKAAETGYLPFKNISSAPQQVWKANGFLFSKTGGADGVVFALTKNGEPYRWGEDETLCAKPANESDLTVPTVADTPEQPSILASLYYRLFRGYVTRSSKAPSTLVYPSPDSLSGGFATDAGDASQD